MTDLRYSSSRPPEGKPVFSTYHFVSINYMDKLGAVVQGLGHTQSIFIRQNISVLRDQLMASDENNPFLGMGRFSTTRSAELTLLHTQVKMPC